MKNIKKYFGLTLVALLFAAFTGCKEDDEFGSDNVGLGIKVFSPTKVVAGQPVTINGSGFGDVTEVVFPGDIAVTDFELVSNEMIRVITPKGINIAEEGEKLMVRTSNSKAESQHLMTQGHTQPRTYSAEEGGDVKIKGILKIFGKDMEFVNKATFMDKDGNDVIVQAKDFYRIATNSLSITIPSSVKEGHQIGSIETMDGKKFNLPDFNYVASAGHWETVKTIIWENPDPVTNDAINWNGTYRFALDGNDGNNECIATFDAETWAIIKNGTWYADIEGANPQIRLTDGWWSGAVYTGDDIFAGNELLVDNEDGTMTLTVNLEGQDLQGTIDEKHILFTGAGYTPLRIYSITEIWVEDEEGHWEHKSLWKNDGSLGEINWNNIYRFANEENKSGEECFAFSMEDWETLKTATWYAVIEGANPQIRLTDGWWSGAIYTGDDIFAGNELLADNGDGTMTLTVNLDGQDLQGTIDEKHILFTGGGYTVKEIYIEYYVAGGAPKEVVVWENPDLATNGAINWNNVYRFANEENKSGEEIFAMSMDDWSALKTKTWYAVIEGANPQIRLTDGWWSGAIYTGDDIFAGNELLVDNGDGTMTLTVNLEGQDLQGTIDEKHILFTGGGYTPLKIYYIP